MALAAPFLPELHHHLVHVILLSEKHSISIGTTRMHVAKNPLQRYQTLKLKAHNKNLKNRLMISLAKGHPRMLTVKGDKGK
jgi:hypothetical protein